jgi:hypothetical protein
MKADLPTNQAPSSAVLLERYFGLSEAEILHQIDEHKYFLNLTVDHEIPWQEALDSWTRTVFEPLIGAMESHGLGTDFPDLGVDELFLKVSDHWYFLKRESDPEVSADRAVLDFGSVYAPNDLRRTEYFVKRGR